MILLLCIVVVAAVGSSIGRKKSCGRPCCTGSDCCYTNIVYEEVKLDEEENVLKEIMKKEAKAEVTGSLEDHWQETTGRAIQVEGEWLPLQVCLSPTGNQVEGEWLPLQVCLSPTGNQVTYQRLLSFMLF
ncbi:hypothetical protein EPR50_G00082080 [Perca flavescens]|uniref:Uncharacterized protein n=1 Tax=Perca flavescens TaxID=8167 RepID=A0A484D973_PERFV|nr:hypothetical protein EPR50_G00082080 [Perca flavescens]